MEISPTDARRKLSWLEQSCKQITNIEGIRLIEVRDPLKDRMQGFNCFVYLYGIGNSLPFRVIDDLVLITVRKSAIEVPTPQAGDIAVYLGKESESETSEAKEQKHVGRITTNGQVLSKWGYGHVYEHRIDLVPECYGSEVRFFREQQKDSTI